jgi:two-component system, NarL family, nitrate/nitrite response regulator NarL
MRNHPSFGIILVGKNVLLREGIARILRAEDFRIVASILRHDEYTTVARSKQLLFVVVHTGDDFSPAIEEIELLRARHPNASVVVVADQNRATEPDLAFRAGAAGYLVSAMSCGAFVKSIELVMMGEIVFPPAFSSSAPTVKSEPRYKSPIPNEDEQTSLVVAEETVAPQQLSPREAAILRCLIEGHSNKSIARKIDIAEATVKVHVKAILRKVRVQNRTQAAIWGMNNGLLAPPTNIRALLAPADAGIPLANPIAINTEAKRNGVR